MNIYTTAPDSMLLGYFFYFTLTRNQQWEVELVNETRYRINVHVSLPESVRENWLSGFNSIIRRLQIGYRLPIRLDYENVAQFFTVDQLRLLEKANPTVSFRLYEAPAKLTEPIASSKLDLDAIRRSVNRKKYAEECLKRKLEREAAATTSA